ncbi:TSUP family transporter [Desulforhopalus sp. 52FAK]
MELTILSMDVLAFLFLAAFIAGFLDTLAGGGGLIVLPALIISGIPPLLALGTNKLQGTMGTATATLMMLRSRAVRLRDVRMPMLYAFLGSVAGTIAVQFIDTRVLVFVIPLVLLLIAIYFILSPLMASKRTEPLLSRSTYQRVVVPLIGWYDGMFGPGTGSFFALAGVSLRAKGLVDATAVAKTFNFATNIGSLCIFLIVGKVMWSAGLIMMLGQVMGAWAGSKCLLKINPALLRLVVVVMCLAMLCKYLLSLH